MPETPEEYLSETNDESTLLSFVIRLWKEESVSGEQHTMWRGHITPIPDGKRHYFTNITDIPEMIVNYLKSLR